MKNQPGKQPPVAKRACSIAVGMLLLQLTTATAEPLVPGAWVQLQRATEQQAADVHMVDNFSGLEVIAMEELGEMRGGLAIGGLEIDVGAVVRTIVDGQLALESHISLATANEIAAAIGADPVNTALTTTPGGSNGVETSAGVNSPAANVTIEPTNAAANPATNTRSNFVINDAKGLTQVIHDVSRNSVVSAIVNQANGRNIRQEVDINITVSNFREIQRAAALQRASSVLNRVGR